MPDPPRPARAMPTPDREPPAVSVVIPVWNVEPYLRECLDSVVGQTIGLDRLEVLAVDDGSTDASGAILDDYAARYPQFRVFHEPNSGGPGRPRNVGLDHATGSYVFFLDADDYLGPEALERLLAMAERNGSDIVLGRIVGVGGRAFRSKGILNRDRDRVDLARASRVGNVQKLFRRAVIERRHRRFGEGVALDEDADFMAAVSIDVRIVSVVGEYACYYLRLRPGSQIRRSVDDAELLDRIRRLEERQMQIVAARHPPGSERDAMLYRSIKKLAFYFQGHWRRLDPDERRRVFDAGRAVVQRWSSPRIRAMLPAWARLRIHCLERELLAELEDVAALPNAEAFASPLVERGRVFARYPHFRDGSGIPDDCFDITAEIRVEQSLDAATERETGIELVGRAFLVNLGGRPRIELQRWPRGRRRPIATEVLPSPDLRDLIVDYPAGGFRATIDAASASGGSPLARGTWRVLLTVESGSIRRTVPLLAPTLLAREWRRADRRGWATSRPLVRPAATPIGEVRLRVGPRGAVTPWLEAIEARAVRLARLPGKVAAAHRRGTLVPILRTTLGRLGRGGGPVGGDA